MFDEARKKFHEFLEWCRKDGMTEDDIEELIEDEMEVYDA